MKQQIYARPLGEVGLDDVNQVGGKNASLGEMIRSLSGAGVKVPNGFAVTAGAFRYFLDANSLTRRIETALAGLDVADTHALVETASSIRGWILQADMPVDLSSQIRDAYAQLAAEYGDDPDVAVRSSATAEDLPNASFAGQQDTYLNIRGADELVATCQRVFASLFTERAIAYRVHQGFEHSRVALSVGVQKMVRSDEASSGVLFTLDTESGFRDVVMVTSAYGLGENVVGGAINPDEFLVFKPALAKGYKSIIRRHLGDKKLKMVYAGHGHTRQPTRNVAVRQQDRQRFSISDDEVLELARMAVAIESHYSKQAGQPRPMDIEWAKDGLTGELFIVQARPETVHAQQAAPTLEHWSLSATSRILASGQRIGKRIGTGRARVIMEAERMHELRPGEVLVTDMTDPDWEPVMKIAAAIVTNRGGRVCHAAIIARELGIPAVVGTNNATHCIEDEQAVTVSCAEGDEGHVYAGELPFKVERQSVESTTRPHTKVMMNVGNPDIAFEHAMLPNDGVGLARMEFIIANSIGVHPRALLNFDQLDDELKRQILSRSAGYTSPVDFYVNRLAEGVATIAAAFYPRPVIARMSDFKSNEYAALLGGRDYEPIEDNPMIGLRGAARYYSESFSRCFELECQAMLKVRRDMGLDNLELMIPFVRTVDELRKVLALMGDQGLQRGRQGLKVHTMCELPSNVIRAGDFLDHCDGFSIGSNDLTQLVLGVDRDSELLKVFNERDPAVIDMLRSAIKACRERNKYVGICGQAPSDYPDLTHWLVDQGITSISVNPDAVVEMTQVVLAAEAEHKAMDEAS